MSIDIKVPEMGESISEATIANWLKKEGDTVSAGEILVELETDKVTMEVPSPSSGILSKILKPKGETVKIKEIIANLDENASSSSKPAVTNSPKESLVSSNHSSENNEVLSPAVRKMIEDNKLDSTKIKGTGKNGLITKEDVLNFISSTPQPTSPEKKLESISNIAPVKKFTSDKKEEVVPMSRLRKAIAERLVSAQHTAAILTTFNEINMSKVMEIRSLYKDKFKETHNVGLGFMSFFTKACIQALKVIPAVNAEIRGSDIVYKKFYDIGVAVGGPKGLVVPIVRNADSLSFSEIENEITRLAGRVKDGKIGLDEMEGGTFTISNGGIYGSMMSTPILNPPQSGILGLHNIVKRPVVENDQIVIRPMMYVALSYDHRIIDGKEAVTFLVKVKEIMEDPSRLLLEI